MMPRDLRELDGWVQGRMVRIEAGDDEALNATILELRPLALDLIPRFLLAGSAPKDVVTHNAVVALYQALLVWVPEKETFLSCLERRVVRHLTCVFQGLMYLLEAVS